MTWLSAAAAALYAWYATGLAPFSDLAYAALGVPAAAALLLYGALGGFSTSRDVASYYRSRGTSRAVLPWVVVFAAALGLEIAGLALGGRAKDVPTLSTTLDHLLVTHLGRCLLYLWWFWVGVRAIVPLARQLPPKEHLVIVGVVWWVLIVTSVIMELVARARPEVIPSLSRVGAQLARVLPLRVVLWAGWIFIGLHLFTRYTLPGR